MSLMIEGGELVEGWEHTLLGQTFQAMGIDPAASDSSVLKADGVTPKTDWDWWWESQSSQRNLRAEVLKPSQQIGRWGVTPGRDYDRYLHDIPRVDSALSPENFSRAVSGWIQSEHPKASVSGPEDWRMYNSTYENSHNRTRSFQMRAGTLRSELRQPTPQPTTDEDN